MEKLTKYRALHTQTIISQYGKSETIKVNGNKVPTLTTDAEGFAQWTVKGLIFRLFVHKWVKSVTDLI